MNPVFRGVVIYIFLLLIFRIMGKRTLNETTTFDAVLLLIISEVTQQALVGEDFSLTTSAVLIITLMGLDIIFTLLKQGSPTISKLTEGVPLILVADGKPLQRRMDKTKVDEDDILRSARQTFGLEKMEQIKYAVLEKDGSITIVPFEK